MASSQKDFRIEPPVHITFDLQVDGDATGELDHDVLVLDDLTGAESDVFREGPKAGQVRRELPDELAKRKAIEIQAATFDHVLRGLAPRVAFVATSTLEDREFPVDVTFESMDDFDPAGLAEKVPLVAELMETRRQLEYLLAVTQGTATREAALDRALGEKLPELSQLIEGGKNDSSAEGA
ncbi:MAG: type VI secretion system contractile sheath small subunit [Myxococcales bacterium]|nr:type VI secretion system contractile sheath small subunit [Myxococcales bacterium]MDD9968502.1 type VI secretion system contractile sheath small subunit [Myxococcales bacterium]